MSVSRTSIYQLCDLGKVTSLSVSIRRLLPVRPVARIKITCHSRWAVTGAIVAAFMLLVAKAGPDVRWVEEGARASEQ